MIFLVLPGFGLICCQARVVEKRVFMKKACFFYCDIIVILLMILSKMVDKGVTFQGWKWCKWWQRGKDCDVRTTGHLGAVSLKYLCVDWFTDD